MLTDFVKPGDKIDITYLHQNNGKVYKSGVFDMLGGNDIEITMPTDEGKMVLLQTGFECQFFFYTSKGMFLCEAIITGRFKRDNFYLLSAKIKSPLKKYQRREYYRVDTLLDFAFYKISKETAELETTEELFEEIANPEYIDQKVLARTKDLSGGGVRFTTTGPLEAGEKILAILHLVNDKMDHMLYLVAEVIESFRIDNMQPEIWVNRAKWQYKNKRDMELVIKYVFEEDRMIRKKENG